ncbi:hypothetical protein BX285_5055 [Streptomyces sp. 1114.5]|uniref:hypothetical protein n=1 Tax=Streptomyces sp. 1114.5 TaxID=1938830 RepID=UPI000F23DA7A|nr:hypothetical protein [Streptomyces sp. 1114.5]RKT11120.1 hypothetical protein BX285_5055 [Streptomyces sp. 1114.5]
MAAREDTARDVQHEPARHGRHGRPRPFGGRLRLPTLRFSGAAMAMSTVVGISIATTLLLNEQQGIGRRAGVARVGTTPPPTPGATDQAEAVAAQTPTGSSSNASATGGPSGARPSGRPSTHPSGAAPVMATPPANRSADPSAPAGGHSAGGQTSGGQTSGEQDAPPPGTQLAGTEAGAPAGPSPSAQPPAPTADQPAPGQSPNLPGVKPTAPARPGPPPAATVPGACSTAPAGTDSPDGTDPEADHALSGASLVAPLGRDGLRHELVLTVTEPVTALQTEFRLAPGDSAPGPGTAWTDLPGAVVTAQQERGTLVYRFTTPPGTDVRPGHYGFGVRGTRPAATDPSTVRKSVPAPPAAPAESWSASAFAIGHPRAVAALGGFAPAPQAPASR